VSGPREVLSDWWQDGLLRRVIRKPRALVRFDEHVLRLGRRLHDEVDAGYRHVDRARRLDRSFHELGVHLVGDVVDGAAGVQIGGLAHGDLGAVGRHVVQSIAGAAHVAMPPIRASPPSTPQSGIGSQESKIHVFK